MSQILELETQPPQPGNMGYSLPCRQRVCEYVAACVSVSLRPEPSQLLLLFLLLLLLASANMQP